MATPRTDGRLFNHLARPALPKKVSLCEPLDTIPKVAVVSNKKNRCSPEFKRIRQYFAFLEMI